MNDLGRTDFNDRARSMVVQAGSWEICRDDGFRGGCQLFGPGRHGSLGFLAGEVSSIRPAGGGGGRPDWGGGRPPDEWGGRGRVVLYQQQGFGGRALALDQEVMPNFASSGFNDRASSLRVEGGYWMFCSDADFRGTCRTFGPGDYPTLPPGLESRISSGRRISNDYPYNANPDWRGAQRP
ncbi:MAG: beta/gamma crystallin-related protein [Betaproteobacteria bacterium]